MNQPPSGETGQTICRHGLTGKWWVIKHDNGDTGPVGPFDTKEDAESAPSQRKEVS